MERFHPRGCLLATGIVRQRQIVCLLRLRAQRVQWCQHLDSALPLLPQDRHSAIGSEDVKDIQDLRDIPWHLPQPCQCTVRRQRGWHGKYIHTGISSSECLLEKPVSGNWIWRGVLDSGQESQAL